MSTERSADWLAGLRSCRCGSRPVFAAGSFPEEVRFSGFISCRAPERHGEDNYAVIGSEGSVCALCGYLESMWDALNPVPSTGEERLH